MDHCIIVNYLCFLGLGSFNSPLKKAASLDHFRAETVAENAIGSPKFYDPNNSNADQDRPKFIYIRYKQDSMREHLSTLRKRAPNYFAKIGVPYFKTSQDPIEYWTEMKRHKFVLSPPGHGEDCYRTWEAILFGSIPIVRNSSLWPLYSESPVYVLNDWENVTEKQFLDFRLKTQDKKVVLSQYWFDQIAAVRREYLTKYK